MWKRLAFARGQAAGLALALTTFAAVPAVRAAPAQQEGDAYTRYELLAPGSGKFRITYDVTVFTPGGTAFFNPIRPGSVSTDERVTDRASGEPLKFEVVDGSVAKAAGLEDGQAGRPVHPGDAGAARARRRRPGADPDREDLRGREELPRQRRRDRLQAQPRHQAQRRGPARGLRAHVLQHALAGDPAAGRAHSGELPQRHGRRGAAGAARQEDARPRRRARAQRRGQDRGAGGPDARHRLFPEAPGDPRLRPLPRLHGDAAGRGRVRQRGARGLDRVRAVRPQSRHRRAARRWRCSRAPRSRRRA